MRSARGPGRWRPFAAQSNWAAVSWQPTTGLHVPKAHQCGDLEEALPTCRENGPWMVKPEDNQSGRGVSVRQVVGQEVMVDSLVMSGVVHRLGMATKAPSADNPIQGIEPERVANFTRRYLERWFRGDVRCCAEIRDVMRLCVTLRPGAIPWNGAIFLRTKASLGRPGFTGRVREGASSR
jgi:hypothetical protein